MVFFGTKASRIKDGQINNVSCPNCENNTSMTYAIFGKYAHIYWIPAFPTGRENIIECNSCKRTFKLKELSTQIKQKFDLERQDARTPFWYFSGLAIIAAAIGLGMYSSAQNDANNALFIQSPEVGDVYSIDGSEDGYYSTMKVTDVSTDSIFVVANDYEIDKKSGIDDIDTDKNYTTEIFALGREDLINLFKDETIFDIDRE